MLNIDNAIRFINAIAKADKDDDEKITDILFTNYIDTSFGREYLRTDIKINDFHYRNEYTYVSYRIFDDYRDSNQQKLYTFQAITEQIKDVFTMRSEIKKLLPNVSVHIILEQFDFVPEYGDVSIRDFLPNGESVVEIIETVNNEFIKKEINNKLNELKRNIKRFKQWREDLYVK